MMVFDQRRGSSEGTWTCPVCSAARRTTSGEREENNERASVEHRPQDHAETNNNLNNEQITKLVNISASDFEARVLDSTRPVVLYVHSDRCRGCRVQLKTMRDLALKFVGRLDLFVIDGEQSRDVLTHLGVTHAPTVVFLNKGKILSILEGITPIPTLLVVIKSHFGISLKDRERILEGG